MATKTIAQLQEKITYLENILVRFLRFGAREIVLRAARKGVCGMDRQVGIFLFLTGHYSEA